MSSDSKPVHNRTAMDHSAAILRCVFTMLPLSRIAEGSRDNKANHMEVFVAKYCKKLCDEALGAFEKNPSDRIVFVLG